MKKVSVLIVDDVASVRDGLRSILELYDDIEIVGEAANGQEALVLAEALRPNIIVLDVKMPVMDGIEATRRIKQQRLANRVLILTIDNRLQTRQAALEAGADRFIEKSSDTTQLIKTILQFKQECTN